MRYIRFEPQCVWSAVTQKYERRRIFPAHDLRSDPMRNPEYYAWHHVLIITRDLGHVLFAHRLQRGQVYKINQSRSYLAFHFHCDLPSKHSSSYYYFILWLTFAGLKPGALPCAPTGHIVLYQLLQLPYSARKIAYVSSCFTEYFTELLS